MDQAFAADAQEVTIAHSVRDRAGSARISGGTVPGGVRKPFEFEVTPNLPPPMARKLAMSRYRTGMFELREDDPVLVIGSAGLDIVGRAGAPLRPGTSNPGLLRFSYGGVARNVAENLARLGSQVILVSAVGGDDQGAQLLAHMRGVGVDVGSCLVVPGSETAAYLALLDEGGKLHLALDDMSVTDAITPDHIRRFQPLFRSATAVFVDANLSPAALSAVFTQARRAKVPVVADPTSVSLASRLQPHLNSIWMITPNETEASTLCPHPVPHADRNRALDAARHLVAEGIDIAVITMAEFGVAYASANSSGHVPAVETEVLDPTGAGDALTAALLFSLQNGIPLDEAVRLAASAAALTLRTQGTVVPDLSLEGLYDALR